jgi:hypothetical protein
MEQWWRRHRHLIDGKTVRGGYTKDEVEDFTGCIPLLLENCIMDKKIDLQAEAMEFVWKEVIAFVSKMKRDSKTSGHWDEYAILPGFKLC